MAQRIRSIIVVCALLLAVMAAWASHISTSLISDHQPAIGVAQLATHNHENHPDDHAHAPVIGDHQHETPHLGGARALKERLVGSFELSELNDWLPNKPVFRIKRPPRPQLVI